MTDAPGPAVLYAPESVAACPRAAGAYAVVLRLPDAVTVPVPRPGGTLPAGLYVYLGAANGPGGLRARLRRHVLGGNRRHWHLDYLRPDAEVVAIAAQPGGSECAWTAALLDGLGATAPLARFGSSDCRRCPAHLLRLPEDTAAAKVTRLGDAAAQYHVNA
jgi:histidyl-tRNA synthetase